jgi:thiopurine S-methyltransferase
MGFKNITLMDFAETSKSNFLKRYSDFPEHQFVVGDFFETNENFDYILEQTFFCALHPSNRTKYIKHMSRLLGNNGKLVGLLFDAPLNTEHPPFGGSLDTYTPLFEKYFSQIKMTPCKNSIEPRLGKELWIEVSQ